jgi:hypothetical protein
MAKNLFYPRVQPEREFRKNAGGRKLRPVTELTPTQESFESQNVPSMLYFITKEPSVYDGMVRRTARYIAKKVVDGKYDHETAPSVWGCTAASLIRHVALSHGIDDIFEEWQVKKGGKTKTFDNKEAADEMAKRVSGTVTKRGIWSKESVHDLSKRLSDWFIEQLRLGEDAKKRGVTYNYPGIQLEDGLNVFGDVDITNAGTEYEPEWTIKGDRNRYRRAHRDSEAVENPAEDPQIEAKLNFIRKTLERVKKTLPDGTVVPLPKMIINARVAAMRKKLTSAPAQTPPVEPAGPKPFMVGEELYLISPDRISFSKVNFRGKMPNGQAVVVINGTQMAIPMDRLSRKEPKLKPRPKPPVVEQVVIEKPEDLTVEEAYQYLLKAMQRLHAIQAADPKAKDLRGVNTPDLHITKYILDNWGEFQNDPEFPQGLAQLMLTYINTQLTNAESFAVLRLLPRVAKLGKGKYRSVTFEEYDRKKQKLLKFIQDRKMEVYRAGRYRLFMRRGPHFKQGGEPIEIPGYATLEFPEDMTSGIGRVLSADVVKQAYPEGFSTYQLTGNRYHVKGNRLADMKNLTKYMDEKGGTLEIDLDVTPINAHSKAERAIVLEYIDLTDKKKWGEQARNEPGAFFNIHHTTGRHDPLVDILKQFIPKVDWRGTVKWDRPWERKYTWGAYGLSKAAFEQFTKILRGQGIDTVVIGKQVFAEDPRDKPLKMPVYRAAANVEFYIPEEFKEVNVPMVQDNGSIKLINLKEELETLLQVKDNEIVDTTYIRASTRKGIPGHYIIEYASLNDDLLAHFDKIPALDTSNIAELVEEIKVELKDRFTRPKWAKGAKLELPEQFRFGQFRVDAPNFLASGGDLRPAKLYPYQEEGIRFLLGDTMRILGDDRGLGKTVQSIIAADTLRAAKFPDQPVLVVTPPRLVYNFFDQVHTFSKNTTVILGTIRVNAVYILDADDGRSPKNVDELLAKKYKPQKDGTYAPPKVAFIPFWAKWIITAESAAKILRTLWRRTDIDVEPHKDLTPHVLAGLDNIPSGENLKPTQIAPYYTSGWLKSLKDGIPAVWSPEKGDRKRTVVKEVTYVMLEGEKIPVSEKYKVTWTVTTNDSKDDGKRSKEGSFKVIAKYLDPNTTEKLERRMAPLLNARLIRYFFEESAVRTIVMGRKWDLIIFDEAHTYKQAGGGQQKPSGAYLFARELMKNAKNAWFLTGTPIANKIIDLWALFHLTSHELGVGENYNAFGEEFAGGGPKFAGLTNLEDLRNRSSNVLLWRYKDDVAGIPVQQLYMKELKMPESVKTDINTGTYTDSYGNKKRVEVPLQKWDMYLYGGTRMEMGPNRKRILGEIANWKVPFTVEEALNAIEEGHKVIVFSSFSNKKVPIITRMIEAVDKYLARPDTKKFKYVVTVGGVSKPAMNQRVQQFTYDKDTKLLLGNIKTAGTGLNLQAATYSIFNDVGDSPAEHEQAEDRTRRINQFNCTEVVYMVSDAVEDVRIWDKLWDRRGHIEQAQEGRDDPDAYQRDTLEYRVKQQHPDVEFPSKEFDALLKFYRADEDADEGEWDK